MLPASSLLKCFSRCALLHRPALTSSSRGVLQRRACCTMSPHAESAGHPGSTVITNHLLRDVSAIAYSSRYKLADIVAAAPLLKARHELDVVLTFPTQRKRDEGDEHTHLVVPYEIVLLCQERTKSYLAILSEGTLVAFGIPADVLQSVRATLREWEDLGDPCAWGDAETVLKLRYVAMRNLPSLGFETPADAVSSYIDEGELDAIVLVDESVPSVIPFVYCLSRRVQIEACNQALKPIVDDVGHWRRTVGETGKLPFTVKQCRTRNARAMRLLGAQSRIAIRPRLFSVANFSGLRHIYGSAYEHFELSDRSEALRHSIESVAGALSYMGREVNQRTDERLEIVIIVLLWTEIVLHLFDVHDEPPT